MTLLSHNEIILRLERSLSLSEMGAFRKMIPIEECGEPLVDISNNSFSFECPHPYLAAGAPYAERNPFCVRESILQKLLSAQKRLQEILPGHRLHIFDAYRPLSVQTYMVSFTKGQVAGKMGLDSQTLSHDEEKSVMEIVYKVWARPTFDPAQPPPHTTGAAIDLTIVDADGKKLDMGSEFDETSSRILPNYYRDDHSEYGKMVHRNRECLNTLMESSGFVRLMHEWWHFSYGDQMWAVLKHIIKFEPQLSARYGSVE